MNRIASIALTALGLRDRAGTMGPQPAQSKPHTAPLQVPVPVQSSAPSHLAQLMDRCHRLRQDLEISADAHPPLKAHIDRVLEDLATTRREIAAMQAAEEEAPASAANRPSAK